MGVGGNRRGVLRRGYIFLVLGGEVVFVMCWVGGCTFSQLYTYMSFLIKFVPMMLMSEIVWLHIYRRR